MRLTSLRRLPVSRAGVALWAWSHRRQIAGWAGYAARSVPKLVAGDADDVLTEGRLRARLAADRRTRSVEDIDVSVAGGVAAVSGTVDPDVRDAVVEIATSTSGVSRVRDELVTRDARRRGRRRQLR